MTEQFLHMEASDRRRVLQSAARKLHSLADDLERTEAKFL